MQASAKLPQCLLGPALVFSLMMCGMGAAAAPAETARHARFLGEPASEAAQRVADWVVQSNDNGPLPFVIVDKAEAKVFVFDHAGQLRGASAALLGMATGDVSVPGIGDRALSTIRPDERTTPAGRFVAGLGHDLGEQDVVWVDYDAAISLHRVITTNLKEQRLRRLASPTAVDNRISYGCINVPASFYDRVVRPAFATSSGLVYVLPEVRSLEDVFPALRRPGSAP